MTRFGIFCPPAVGHLNPMCALALELQRRGHTVILFGVPDALAKVSRLNLTTVEIGTVDYPEGSVDSAYRTLGKLTGKAGLEFTIDFFKRETQMLFREAPQAIRQANIDVLINPFLPFTAKKMCYMMKVVEKMLDWENAGSSTLLSVGYSLRAPELLFRKMEDEEVNTQIEKLKVKSKKIMEAASNSQPSATAEKVVEQKPLIQYDDFAKLELKTGTIVAAEKVEKADKLLKLEVDLGTEKRTIVSGIAMFHNPEQIVNQKVVVVTNLAPRKMRGIESNGMILMAEDADGKLAFVSSDVSNGSNVS
jgi:methionine--tRNA ligase beta chain